jgi:CheY-like chemotaxis protein
MKKLKRILLVEDDPKDIELTLAALAEHNLANEVAIARDGVEALDYLCRQGSFAQRPPDNPVVILLDLKMPRMDGVQVLRQIKADEQLHLIPVVILIVRGKTAHKLDSVLGSITSLLMARIWGNEKSFKMLKKSWTIFFITCIAK